MPRIKVNDAGFIGYSGMVRINFSIVSAPRHGRQVLRSFSSCRDFINDYVISDYTRPEKAGHVDRRYLRLIIARGTSSGVDEEEVRRRMYAAKRIINMYEELAKWKRRSKLARVSFTREAANDKFKNVWLLTGPGEWMKSTHLISMVTIIFRIVVECGGFNECENLEQVETRFNDLCTRTNELLPATDKPGHTFWQSNRADVTVILQNVWPKFRMLMEMYDDLFREVDFQYWNPPTMVGQWHSYGGIRAMCTFNMGVSALNEKIRAAWEKNNKK